MGPVRAAGPPVRGPALPNRCRGRGEEEEAGRGSRTNAPRSGLHPAAQVSFGPLSWLVVSEVFPLKVRSQAIALATLTNFASNFCVSLVLPGIQQAVGQSSALVLGGGNGLFLKKGGCLWVGGWGGGREGAEVGRRGARAGKAWGPSQSKPLRRAALRCSPAGSAGLTPMAHRLGLEPVPQCRLPPLDPLLTAATYLGFAVIGVAAVIFIYKMGARRMDHWL